jgi:hypothetical protein
LGVFNLIFFKNNKFSKILLHFSGLPNTRNFLDIFENFHTEYVKKTTTFWIFANFLRARESQRLLRAAAAAAST